jgi:hypothetical protein
MRLKSFRRCVRDQCHWGAFVPGVRTERRPGIRRWAAPVNLGPSVNSTAGDVGPDLVEDEAGSTVLYFTSTRPVLAGFGAADIYKSTLGGDGSFGAAVLVPELSGPSGDARAAIRTDGLELVLDSTVRDRRASNDLQAALSDDAETQLLSSSRPSGGFGSDIWTSAPGNH